MGIEYFKLKSQFYLLIDYDAKNNPNYATLAVLNSEGILIANAVDQLIGKDMINKLINWIPDASKVSCIANSLSTSKTFFSKLESVGKRSSKNYILTLRSKFIDFIQGMPFAYFECKYGIKDEFSFIGSKWIAVISSIVHHLIVSKETLIREIEIAKRVMSLPIVVEDVISLCRKICSKFEIHQRFNEKKMEYCVVLEEREGTFSYINEDIRIIYFRIISEH